MTCKQLGGACDKEFVAETFDEIAELSKQHGMEMFQAADQDHMGAIQQMMALMASPDGMAKWFEEKRAEFDALPEA